jgi:hypothetical protein
MKQRWGLFFEVLLALMRIAGLAIGAWTGHFLWAVIGYSIATAVALVVQIVWMMAQVRAYDRSLVTTL